MLGFADRRTLRPPPAQSCGRGFAMSVPTGWQLAVMSADRPSFTECRMKFADDPQSALFPSSTGVRLRYAAHCDTAAVGADSAGAVRVSLRFFRIIGTHEREMDPGGDQVSLVVHPGVPGLPSQPNNRLPPTTVVVVEAVTAPTPIIKASRPTMRISTRIRHPHRCDLEKSVTPASRVCPAGPGTPPDRTAGRSCL